jgi:DNA polymerase
VLEKTTAADFLPGRPGLTALREAAAGCQGCELYRGATQTVFGEGPRTAEAMFVGEVPGDQEDLQGRPFVGPAGRLLREVIQEAGLDLRKIYLTNAVKHFKWEPRGKRRLHKKPRWREIVACRPWLSAEVATVRPKLLVLLGATAAQSLLGPEFRISARRGEVLRTEWAPFTMATYHPSAVLRAPEKEDRDRMRAELLDDLRIAVKAASGHRQTVRTAPLPR